jgi:GT2 family glycosyltransferase
MAFLAPLDEPVISLIFTPAPGGVCALDATLCERLARDGVEVVIVEQCGEAGAVGAARRVTTPEQLSQGAAGNLGGAVGSAPLLCFIGDQPPPDRRAMQALAKAAAEAPGVAVFEPTVGWRGAPAQSWADRFRRLHPAPYGRDGAGLSPPTLAVRREAFIGVGGFDESLSDAAIGADLRLRIARQGGAASVVRDWPVSFPFPSTVAESRRWLKTQAHAAADCAVLYGARSSGDETDSAAPAPPGFGQTLWDEAMTRAKARHPRAQAAREDARRGVLSLDALAVAQTAGAPAPHLRAPAIWPAAGCPSLSIVVPSYRRPDHLAALLSSLAPQARAAGAEIVVIDDGSGDAAYARVVEPFADVVAYHRLERNQGRGAATNHGLALARGEWIVFTDDDVRPPSDWLAELANILTRFPDLDAVGGVCRPLGRPQRGLVEAFTLARTNFVPRPYLARGTLKCLITACLAVRASTLREVGGIDASFVAGQDHNLTWRLRRAGARIHLTGDWWVAHDQAWTAWEMMSRMYGYAYWHGRQTQLSGEPIDYLFGPEETWRGLLTAAPAHFAHSVRSEAKADRPVWTKAAYVGLDMLSHLAWNLGGVSGVRAARAPGFGPGAER